jgi:L-alanine-DL-glutamate epimerase-like enolase superfamily enzyme
LSPSAIRDGKLAVPDGPGLGLSIDESVFDRSPYRAQGTITEMRLWAHGNV